MAKINKRELLKRKKQRDQKRPHTPHFSLADQPEPKPASLPGLATASLATRPVEPERETTPFDLWWKEYTDGDGEKRLSMTREKLQAVEPGDEWYEVVFPEAVDELEPKLSAEQFVAFLEELHEHRPDIFAMSACWHVRAMAFEYVAEQQFEKLDHLVEYLAKQMMKIDDPLFSLISLLRLAGRGDAAQSLIDVAVGFIEGSDLMYWAVDRLIEWALFPRYQQTLAAGATRDASDAVYQYSLTLGLEDTPRTRDNQRQYALHLAGQSEKVFTRDELLSDSPQRAHKTYLLVVDFFRWLCQSRGFAPVVADELRTTLVSVLNDEQCNIVKVLQGISRSDFEPYLASKFRFMSLEPHLAPAAVVAMRHFYEFLAERDLVDRQIQQPADVLCKMLWRDLKHATKKDWRRYQFLEQYLPASCPSSPRGHTQEV